MSDERAANANKRFTFSYKFDGSQWALDLWASTPEEAEMKLKAAARGKLLGVAAETIDASEVLEVLRESSEFVRLRKVEEAAKQLIGLLSSPGGILAMNGYKLVHEDQADRLAAALKEKA